MADYPAIAQVVGSKEVPNDGTVVEQAVSGKPRFRTFFTSIRRRFTVVHDVDTTDKDTIMAFHVSNQFVSFTFDWEGDNPVTQYTVRFDGPPQPKPTQGDGRFKVTCKLVAV